MSGIKGLIDTNIIIYLSNDLVEISPLFERYDDLFISRITHMEVLGFNFDDKEGEELAENLVNQFPILEINQEVGESTIEIRKQKRIKLPDAIIYATALVNGCELVTANVRDFNGLEGVEIYNPVSG